MVSIDFSNLKLSDYAAWWGVTIATLALVWNIVTALRSGARLEVTAKPNMQSFPPNPGEEDNSYIYVKAINRGNSATTITNFCGYSADSFRDRIRKNKRQHFMVHNAPDASPIPCKLNPGDEWYGYANQELVFKKVSANYFYIGVIHNQRKKPIYKRVKINNAL